MRQFLAILTIVLDTQVLAASAGPFLVTIFDSKIEVVSPERHSYKLRATFHNKSNGRVAGKVQTRGGRVIDYVNLNSGESQSIPIGHIKGEVILYYPLSPSFQEAELVVGRAIYEIPAKE